MSKRLRTTSGTLLINDTGILLTTTPYAIPSQDYWIWAASSDIVGPVGAATVIVDDGSTDLSISDGIDLIKGIFPVNYGIVGRTNGTLIGNVTDRLKVYDGDVLTILNTIAGGLGVATAGLLVQNEVVATTRTEVDMALMTYTVPTAKKFIITGFFGSYDAQSAIYLRFKKQTGGAGAWNQLFRIVMEVGGQSQSMGNLNFGNGLYIGDATDKFKVTVESSVANKGTVWACFTGAVI
jgi:hypothetical protein